MRGTSMIARPSRPGFTLIELLVVIAIIGVLIALLLPAVQAAREAARRSQCTNNLKQLALATANYMDVNTTTPLHMHRRASDYGGYGFSGNRSWYCGLLPFLEQGPMYDSLNFEYSDSWEGLVTGVNATVHRASVSSFLCPSDGVRNKTVEGVGNFSYVANAGRPRNILLPGETPGRRPIPASMGIISMDRMSAEGPYSDNWRRNTNRSFSAADMTDGLSNTAAFSESLISEGPDNRDPRRNLNFTDSAMIEQYDVYADDVVRDGLNNYQNWPDWTQYRGLTWAYTDSWEKHVYTHLFPPNSVSINTYATDTIRCHEGDTGMNPTSEHPGGVNLAMMDGSVRFIKNTINLTTWWALGTRNGGEVISADAY